MAGCEHEDGSAITGVANPSAHFQSIESRHHDVEYDRIRRPVGDGEQAFDPVVCCRDLVALEGEGSFDGSPHCGVVLHHQDSGHAMEGTGRL